MTMTVAPCSIRVRNTPSRRLHIQRVQADGRLIKDKQRVLLGLPISLASFRRWASPPERLGRFLAQGQVTKAEFL